MIEDSTRPHVHVVVLAAGKGTRMKARRAKVLHAIAGLPMLEYVLRTADQLGPRSALVVIGHSAEEVRAFLATRPAVVPVVQEPQLGTGHALLQTEPWLRAERGTLVLISGDVPLLRAATLERLVDAHVGAGAAATVLTAIVERPYGYGRIIRRGGRLQRIVEERDASPQQRGIREINSGIYALDLPPLFDALRGIAAENAQGEYYLPDLVAIYRRQGLPVEAVLTDDPDEIRGINSQTELAEVAGVVRQTKNEELMAAGVVIEDPATTYVGPDVEVGSDTVIHPGVHLEGTTRIGSGCEIHAGVRVVDSTIEDGVVVLNHCIITGSRLAAGAVVGPFAHLRPESDVGRGARVGNFVELKKTSFGAGSKANHLSYLGDATIGENVNIGAGTITCNYDGVTKHRTVIEDGVFVGSDAALVAPVRIGRGAYVAAGSSITQDVPPGALGIARGQQVNKEGWVERRRKR